MARPIPFNRQGIYGLETIGATGDATALTYTFANHPYVNSPFNGVLLIHFTATTPTGVTATTPIFFETQGLLGSRREVKKPGGGALTAGDITSPGYYLFFYDFRQGIVEAIGEFNATAPSVQTSEKTK